VRKWKKFIFFEEMVYIEKIDEIPVGDARERVPRRGNMILDFFYRIEHVEWTFTDAFYDCVGSGRPAIIQGIRFKLAD
jgi:hypothetical protein